MEAAERVLRNSDKTPQVVVIPMLLLTYRRCHPWLYTPARCTSPAIQSYKDLWMSIIIYTTTRLSSNCIAYDLSIYKTRTGQIYTNNHLEHLHKYYLQISA
jgi:hypothetical protein